MSDRPGEFEELLLLGVMALDNLTYGVPLQRYLSRAAGHEVSMGAVYATLDRLERKGLLQSVLGAPTAERGGKRKRFYSATPDARRVLRDARRLRDRLWRVIEEHQ